MSKQPPRRWVGYLDDEINGGLVLYDRKSPYRSPHDVYLYHYSTNQIINHFKYTVKERLRPLNELSHTMGGGPWDSFRGDPYWELAKSELINELGIR